MLFGLFDIATQVFYTNVLPGDFSGGVTPDSIPNSEVKSSSADDTTNGGKVGRCQGFFLFFIYNTVSIFCPST